MKNILYIHSGAELYGADQILLKLVGNIDRNKFNPIVVIPNDGPLTKEFDKLKIKYYIFPFPIVRRKYFNVKGIFMYFKTYINSCKEIIKLCKKEKIDVIHNNTLAVLEGIYVHKKTGIPLVYHIHEMIEKPKIIAKILYKLAVSNANVVVCVSKSVKEHINKFVKNKKENIIVIHNGIEELSANNIETDYLYDEFDIPKDSIIFATIGRINAIKGQSDFILSLKELIKDNKKVYGIIVGDAFEGQEWRVDDLKKMIKDCNCENNIKYVGFRNDVVNIEKMMDYYVLSSVQFDSFPTVVLESLRLKKFVLAYKCGGVEEMIVNGENGFLVEMKNIKELSSKMKNVVEDNLKINDNSYFENNFSISKFIDRFENEYEYLKNK